MDPPLSDALHVDVTRLADIGPIRLASVLRGTEPAKRASVVIGADESSPR